MPLASDALKTSVVMVAVEVVDLDGVLDADGGDDAKGARGRLRPALDLIGARQTGLDRCQRSGLDRCHPKLLPLLPPPHPSVSQRLLSYITTAE